MFSPLTNNYCSLTSTTTTSSFSNGVTPASLFPKVKTIPTTTSTRKDIIWPEERRMGLWGINCSLGYRSRNTTGLDSVGSGRCSVTAGLFVSRTRGPEFNPQWHHEASLSKMPPHHYHSLMTCIILIHFVAKGPKSQIQCVIVKSVFWLKLMFSFQQRVGRAGEGFHWSMQSCFS